MYEQMGKSAYAVNWFSFSAWKNRSIWHCHKLQQRCHFWWQKGDCIIMKVKCIAQMATLPVTRYSYTRRKIETERERQREKDTHTSTHIQWHTQSQSKSSAVATRSECAVSLWSETCVECKRRRVIDCNIHLCHMPQEATKRG